MPALSDLILPNLIILAAAALQAATGVGFAMIAVPLLGLIDLAWLPAPMLQVNILLSLVMILRDRRALVPAEAPPLFAGLALGTVVGAGILALIPAERLGLAIGLVICAAVALSLFTPAIRLSRPAIFAGGTAGGVTGIVAAMHGPPLILLYQRERPEKVRATMAGVFVAGCVMALAALWASGRYGSAEVGAGLSLIPGLALGYIAGRWAAGRISPRTARAAMLAVSGAAGAMLVLKSL